MEWDDSVGGCMISTLGVRNEFPRSANENNAVTKVYLASQLQPWLVPHWVQTPQAPARITLSEPQFEQVIPM